MGRQVTFTFTLRRCLDASEAPLCRKEATFTFKKETDNRGWRECIPPGVAEESPRLYLTVEVLRCGRMPPVSTPVLHNPNARLVHECRWATFDGSMPALSAPWPKRRSLDRSSL